MHRRRPTQQRWGSRGEVGSGAATEACAGDDGASGCRLPRQREGRSCGPAVNQL